MASEKKNAREVVQETVQAVREKTELAKENVEGKVSEARKTVREKAEKNPRVAAAVTNTRNAADKVVKGTKKAAQRTTAAAKKFPASRIREVYVQYQGKEVLQSELVEKVVAAYVAEGNKRSSIKELELYIKPEDNAAYYVINATDTGKVAF